MAILTSRKSNSVRFRTKEETKETQIRLAGSHDGEGKLKYISTTLEGDEEDSRDFVMKFNEQDIIQLFDFVVNNGSFNETVSKLPFPIFRYRYRTIGSNIFQYIYAFSAAHAVQKLIKSVGKQIDRTKAITLEAYQPQYDTWAETNLNNYVKKISE